MKAFWAFDKAAVAEEAIAVKYKELIAVAVALTTQCSYCIEIHSGNARRAGTTDAELTEAAMVAAALRAGAGSHTCIPCSSRLISSVPEEARRKAQKATVCVRRLPCGVTS